MSNEIRATLKTVGGEVLATITLPRSAADIPLSRYVSFLSEMRKFQLENANPMQIMSQAVSEITGIPLSDILLSKVGEQWSQDKELDGGIRSLYGWCVNALSNYKGQARNSENYTFEYKGEVYKIPYLIAAEIAGGMPTMNMPFSAGESIEAWETIRGFNQQIKDAGDPKGERAKRIGQLRESLAKEKDENGEKAREIARLEAEIDVEGDPNGNLMFAQYLRMIAIIARKEDEKLPTGDADRERWIQARMIHLQEIDTKTGIDVDFFLTGLSSQSGRTHPVISSLILPLFALSATIQSRPQPKGKRTIAQWRTKKKFKNGSGGGRLFIP